MEPINKEIEFFEGARAELLAAHEGKVALIAKTKLLGVFDDEATAISEGYKACGLHPFFVKRIAKIDSIATFPALSIGASGSKRFHIGYFNTVSEAAEARKEAEIKHGFADRHGST